MTVYKMGGREAVEESDDGKDDKTQFSIRLPNKLLAQVDARRVLSKRSRNKEIEVLVERQIEAEVEKDRELMARIAERNATLKNSQS